MLMAPHRITLHGAQEFAQLLGIHIYVTTAER